MAGSVTIPLGFIVNELITNAAKYGKGRITVTLEPDIGKGCDLSVANDGAVLLQGFDPAASKGLGMTLFMRLSSGSAVNCELVAAIGTNARELPCCSPALIETPIKSFGRGAEGK